MNEAEFLKTFEISSELSLEVIKATYIDSTQISWLNQKIRLSKGFNQLCIDLIDKKEIRLKNFHNPVHETFNLLDLSKEMIEIKESVDEVVRYSQALSDYYPKIYKIHRKMINIQSNREIKKAKDTEKDVLKESEAVCDIYNWLEEMELIKRDFQYIATGVWHYKMQFG